MEWSGARSRETVSTGTARRVDPGVAGEAMAAAESVVVGVGQTAEQETVWAAAVISQEADPGLATIDQVR